TSFTPNSSIGTLVAVECLTATSPAAGCNITAYTLPTTDASGNMSFFFTVLEGTVGNGTCGTSATDATCSINIAVVATQLPLASGPITFASGGTTTTTTPTTTTTTPTTTTTTPTTTTTTPTTT